MCGVVQTHLDVNRRTRDAQGTRVVDYTLGWCLGSAVRKIQVFFGSTFRHISQISAPDGPHACNDLLPLPRSSPGAVRNAIWGNRLSANSAPRLKTTMVGTDYALGTRYRNWSIEITHLPVCRLEIWGNTYTTYEQGFLIEGCFPPSDQGIA